MKDIHIAHDVKSLLLAALVIGLSTGTFAASFLDGGKKLDIGQAELEQLLVHPASASQGTASTSTDEPLHIQIDDMLFPVREVQNDDGVTVYSAFEGHKWTDGNVYYAFDANVSTLNRQRFRNAAAEWSAVADLTFIEGMGLGNYIYVISDVVNSSYVGMVGGRQYLRMYNWSWKYIIAHEIGHALGLWHEHQRSDRDSYVTILWDNIYAGTEQNFILRNTTDYGAYDFDSVMHYRKNAFSIDYNNLNTIEPKPPYSPYLDIIGQRSSLSDLDKDGMTSHYGVPNRIVTTPATYDFGVCSVGTTPGKNVILQNSGAGTIAGTISVPSPFVNASSSSYSLSYGQSQTITIRYSPTSTGTHNASISFSSGESMPLSGTAVTPGDTDGDGHQDWEESIAGTNPNNSTDVCKLAYVDISTNDTIIVEFPSKSGRTYQVQSKNGLTSGTWIEAGPPISGDGTMQQATVPSPGDKGIYRITINQD